MPVYHRFNFLGMNFQSTDIDDTAPPSNKVIAVATQFHHIAGVDKAVQVDQRGYVPAYIGFCGAFGPDT